MANPLDFTIISGQSGSASFTTQFATLNYQLGSIHVIYSGMDTETGTIQIRGTNDLVARTSPATAKWSALVPAVTTLVSSCDNRLFNISDLGYNYVQLQYVANSNTTGTLNGYATLKSYS